VDSKAYSAYNLAQLSRKKYKKTKLKQTNVRQCPFSTG